MPIVKNLDGATYYAIYLPRQDRYVRLSPGKPMLIRRLQMAERQVAELKDRHPKWDFVIHQFTLVQADPAVPLADPM